MLVIHPTKSLVNRMGISLKEAPGISGGRLRAFYAADIYLLRQPLILLISEYGRLPLLMKAAPFKSFPERFPWALMEVLQNLGICQSAITAELSHMQNVQISKKVDRSFLGTLVQNEKDLEGAMNGSHPPTSLIECSSVLANGICMPLKEKIPAEAVRKILSRPHLRLV